jgi:hypothetical protein
MAKVLILGLASILATFLVVSIIQDRAKIEGLEKSKDRGKLSWYAEMAKAKGQREVTIPTPISEYTVPRSFDEALAYYSLVVAEPVEQKSYAQNEGISTWYKFRVVEELSRPTVQCNTCPGFPAAPAEMLPVEQNEFLAAQIGGEAQLNEVRLISRDPDFPAFVRGKKYLLFLSFDPKKEVGALRMGPWGTFSLDSSENLKAVDSRLKHPVKDELSKALAIL